MLYNEIKSYIQPVSLQKRKTTNELLKMPKVEFIEILDLYIKLWWLLKFQWLWRLVTPEPKKDKTWKRIHVDFESRDFDYLIMSKGNNILNDIILPSVITKCTVMVETYIENKLLEKNPQLEYFTQFALWNYEGLKYVFNNNIFNEDVLFVYTDAESNNIDVTDKMEYNKMNKDTIMLINNSLKTTDKIKASLFRLKDWHFVIFKKFVIKAAEEIYKWNDLEQDWKFMMDLEKAINN